MDAATQCADTLSSHRIFCLAFERLWFGFKRRTAHRFPTWASSISAGGSTERTDGSLNTSHCSEGSPANCYRAHAKNVKFLCCKKLQFIYANIISLLFSYASRSFCKCWTFEWQRTGTCTHLLIVFPSKSWQTAVKNTTPLSLSPTFVTAPQSANFGQDATFLSLIGRVQGIFSKLIHLFINFFHPCVCLFIRLSDVLATPTETWPSSTCRSPTRGFFYRSSQTHWWTRSEQTAARRPAGRQTREGDEEVVGGGVGAPTLPIAVH